MKGRNASWRAKAQLALAALVWCGVSSAARAAQTGDEQKINTPGGELIVLDKDGRRQLVCPLQRTDVKADIAGMIPRVHVRQTFHNPLARKIEAVYTFPLPDGAAVDEMTMLVGDRRIRGVVQPREEARKTYEAAKAKGHVAGLLDQERPNIFTQAVANIEPNTDVVVEISYVETLKWQDGVYEWVFPTVVGPRYMPGGATGKNGTGWSPDTTQVPDASRISPPVALPKMRSGHDISLRVQIHTGQAQGLKLREIESRLHAIKTTMTPDGAIVELANKDEIPNRDFVLRYRLATDEIGNSLLLHSDARGHFFTLVLQPPQRVTRKETVPRELVFVLDTSGSMSGFPIEKAKSVIKRAIDNLGPRDEFNLITFAGDTRVLWNAPRPSTPENRAVAQKFLAGQSGGGGTEMMKAIDTALESGDKERIRIVCFMTDGYVGNDMDIINAIKKNAKTTRVFSFGVGDSVNRYLMDGMAKAGRGAAEYVTLGSDGDKAAARFYQRINAPVLTDIDFDWGNLPVEEVYPDPHPDLFAREPILIHGRLKEMKSGTFVIKGHNANGLWERHIKIVPNKNAADNAALPSLWARAKVAHLMDKDLSGMQAGTPNADIKRQITALGVKFHLMTQFTSFVAVEEERVTKGEGGGTVAVPTDMPNGVSYEGNFGEATSTPVASAMTNSRYRVAQGSRFAARGGDPLLSVEAPADATQVIAVLPSGEIKQLRFDAISEKWEARFDIPTYAADGEYTVRVVIVKTDNTRQMLKLSYRVDTTAPLAAGTIRRSRDKTWSLWLDASDDTARVEAILPNGRRVELQRDAAQPERFVTQLAFGKSGWKNGSVTFLVTDRAHNRTSVTVDMSR
jgi:Ca-activated chloride channel family protein